MAGWFKRFKSQGYPLDRLAIALIVGLTVAIGLLIVWGDRTQPKVREFSWAQQTVGAEDTAFTLTFNRPMDWQSVTEKLQIAPPLPGKTSWSGRRFAYTLTQPMPYGQAFQLNLSGAAAATKGTLDPFTATFKSRDLAFAYLGVNGDEAGRLILVNVTQSKKTVLTPANLSVLSFKSYPNGDRILFTAAERTNSPNLNLVDAQLYRVTTGLGADSQPGQVEKVLDNQDYQILKFDLSADGDRIVIERAARQNMMDANLWQIRNNGQPERIPTAGGGVFLIAPDSQTLVLAQGQGLAVVPLDGQTADQPLDFLPQFGMVLSFSRDGSAATMVKFNTDYTRSLFLVTNQGQQTELLRTKGNFLATHFTPNRDALYGLLTRLLPGKDYQEQPYIAKIDLKTRKIQELLDLPIQRDVNLTLAPDGSQLLFDQSIATPSQAGQPDPANQSTKNIWSLSLLPSTADAQPTVKAVGAAPQWLP